MGAFLSVLWFMAAVSVAQTVRVSDFGHDADDSTRFIQAALDSGAGTVILDRSGSPWMTDSLALRSNMRLVLEPGVELCARKGGLLDRYAALVSADAVTNVTVSGAGGVVRLRREDYARPPYRESQHRHAFACRGGVNVTVEGLTIIGAGGDGVYVCGDRMGRPTRNLTVRDVTVTNSYRQGMSVISVKGLRVERVRLLGTKGTAPEAGIDFEPNFPHECLQDILVRDTLVSGNAGNGFGFSLWRRAADDPPVTARFENCLVEGGACSVFYLSDSPNQSFPRGRISFRGCTFANAARAAIRLSQKPKEAVSFTFENCRAENCGGANGPEILLYPGFRDDPPSDGIDFGDFTILRGAGGGKRFLDAPTGNWMTADVTALTGRITLVEPMGTRTVALDAPWRAATFRPASSGATPARCVPDAQSLMVRDGAPGAWREMTALPVRFRSRWLAWVERPRVVRLRVAQTKVTFYKASKVPVRVYRPDGRKAGEHPMPGFDAPGEVSFEASVRGLYALAADASGNAFAVTASDVPVALDLETLSPELWGVRGTVAFASPGKFALFTQGTGRVRLLDPQGETCFAFDGASGWNRHLGVGAPGLFTLTLDCPMQRLDLLGAPCHLFPDPGRTWTSARTLTTVRATDFGFRDEDATKALKAALASEAARVSVGISRRNARWNVAAIRQPVQGKEIVFEDGVVVRAKKGALLGTRDCLLDLSGSTNLVLRGYGATLEMHKGDYLRPPYRASSNRQGIRLADCRNVTLEGFRIVRPANAGVQVGPRADGVTLRDLTVVAPTDSAVLNLAPYSALSLENVEAK